MNIPLYVHIPYCLKKCGYCDFFSMPSGEVPSEYVKAVARQIEWLSKAFSVEEWTSVYIGGGTPSLLSPNGLAELCRAAKAAAPTAENCEWTIEMNPGTITRGLLEAAADGGVNRLSFGVQCKSDKVLRAAGRHSSERDIEEAVGLIKNFWRGKWSADLIAGLPLQTKKDLERDIIYLAKSGAAHISLYSLTLETGTPLKEKIEREELFYDEEAAEGLWLYGRDLLESLGFEQYEVSNFAKPGNESAHNASYWALKSYLGAGAGATGTIYGKPAGFRYTNASDAAEYIKFWTEHRGAAGKNAPPENRQKERKGLACKNVRAALDFPCQTEELDMATQEFEYLMMSLRTRRGACAQDYRERFGGDLAERLFKSDYAKKWILQKKSGSKTFYAMSREGLLFLNKFLEEL